MTSLRRHVHRCRWLAAALIMAALMVRMLVPMGYMPSVADGVFAMQPCDGQSPRTAMMHETMTSGEHMHADHDGQRDDSGKHRHVQAPCAFSGLAAPSLAGADLLLLAIAIAFIVATIFRAETTQALTRAHWLRPPPQGPPHTA